MAKWVKQGGRMSSSLLRPQETMEGATPAPACLSYKKHNYLLSSSSQIPWRCNGNDATQAHTPRKFTPHAQLQPSRLCPERLAEPKHHAGELLA